MAKEYQPKSSKGYVLPHNLYMLTLYTIRDYERMSNEYHKAGSIEAHTIRDKISGNGIGNPTERKGIIRASLFDRMEAVEQALMKIPDDYRKGIIQNIKYGNHYPDDAGNKTYRRWKQRFIYYVAENLDYV